MKAVIVRGYGGPDVIELADVPVPQPDPGQVRIRVHAAPVQPVDIATRAGRLAEHGLMAASGDVGLGWNLAGVVDAPVPLRGTRVHNVWIHTDGPRLAELAALVDVGQLTPRVAATLPLEQVAAAHQRVAAGGLRGRIVLTLDG